MSQQAVTVWVSPIIAIDASVVRVEVYQSGGGLTAGKGDTEVVLRGDGTHPHDELVQGRWERRQCYSNALDEAEEA